jgi:hypothetical protein
MAENASEGNASALLISDHEILNNKLTEIHFSEFGRVGREIVE